MAQVDAHSDVDVDDSDALSEGGSSLASHNSSAFQSEGDDDDDEGGSEGEDGVHGDVERLSVACLLALGEDELNALGEGSLRGHLTVLKEELERAREAFDDLLPLVGGALADNSNEAMHVTALRQLRKRLGLLLNRVVLGRASTGDEDDLLNFMRSHPLPATQSHPRGHE